MKLYRNVFFIFFIIFSIFFISMFSYMKNTLTEIRNVNIIPTELDNILTDNDTIDSNPVNILIAGIADHYLADTIILCNLNPKNKSINLLSIPRDTLYYINGQPIKINSSYG